ncbi:MAG: ATPase [Rickettsiales bacterium]|nr:MAG: ATPase [Rickettsiales bacterium]
MLFILKLLKRKLIPTSLLTRFMLIIIIPVLIAQLLAVYLFYQRHWYNVTQHTSNLIATEITQLIDEIINNKIYKKQGEYLSLEYDIINQKKLPNFPKNSVEELEILKKSINFELNKDCVIHAPDNKNIFIYLMLEQNLLKIKLPYKLLLNPTTDIFVLWIIFLTLFLLSVSLIFSRNQIKSIIELTYAVESYGLNRKNNKYKPSGAKEIRQAGLAFLKMRDRIKKQDLKRTQLLAMISHDLKTPLTRMRLQIEFMENSEEKEELHYDIMSMQHMIDSYLDFSRGEGGEDFQNIDINEWIKIYVKRKWSGYNILIENDINPIVTLIKPFSFERAITNLIGNSFKYSTLVKISVFSNDEDVIINIEDNGIGIKKEERKLVFKPFYRADKSRSLDNSPGVGLGLAITKEIINGHHGIITLDESLSLKGLLVIIQLPIKK